MQVDCNCIARQVRNQGEERKKNSQDAYGVPENKIYLYVKFMLRLDWLLNCDKESFEVLIVNRSPMHNFPFHKA